VRPTQRVVIRISKEVAAEFARWATNNESRVVAFSATKDDLTDDAVLFLDFDEPGELECLKVGGLEPE
jgi:hypothetical protein